MVDLMRCHSHPELQQVLVALLSQKLTKRRVVLQERNKQGQAQRRLTDEESAKLVAAYQAGAKAHELASQWGIHRVTVTQILKRAGVSRRSVGLSEEHVAEAASLY